MKQIMTFIGLLLISSTGFSSTLKVAQAILGDEDVINEVVLKAGTSDLKSIDVTATRSQTFVAILKFDSSVGGVCEVRVTGLINRSSQVEVKKVSDGSCGR